MSNSSSSLKSVSVLSLCSVGQLLLQFAFQLLLAKYYGTQAEMDTFRAALGFPTVVSTILVGALGFAFIPVFVDTRQNSGERDAWSMASNLAILMVLTCVAITAASMWLARPLMTALQPGFSHTKVEQTVDLFRILVWLIVANSLSTFLRSVYHCHGKFFVTGIAPVVGMSVTVAYCVLAHQAQGIRAVAIAVLLGSVVGVVLQLPLVLGNFRWQLKIVEATRRCLILMAPLIAGAAYYNLDPLVDRYLISHLPTGSLALWGYTQQLTAAIVTVSTTGLAIVAFPRFSAFAAAADQHRLQNEIASAYRFLAFLIVPILAGLLLFSQPIIRDLLQRGKFDQQATAIVAGLLVVYLGQIFAAAAGEIAARVFYASKDTLTPVMIGMCGFTLGLPLKYWIAPTAGLVGIAAVTSLYSLFNIACMLLLLVRRMGTTILKGVVPAVIRAVVGSAAAALVGHFVIELNFQYSALAAAAIGAAAYLLVMYVLGDEFARRGFRSVHRRGNTN